MENQTAWAIPRRLVYAAEPAASLTGLLMEHFTLAPRLSYRCATITPWRSGRSARSPCPPTLMLR